MRYLQSNRYPQGGLNTCDDLNLKALLDHWVKCIHQGILLVSYFSTKHASGNHHYWW